MGLYKHIRELWSKPEQTSEIVRQRLIEWRKEPTLVKIDRPTRLDRARSVGYRAKEGVIVVRARLARGGRMREKIRSGRRPKRFGRKKIVGKSLQWIAEERASKRFANCEVVNSYPVITDGTHAWFEVIMVDKNHPAILKDRLLKPIAFKDGRAERGLTSAGKSSRGLKKKGKGAEKLRPSLRANSGKAK